MSTVSGQSPTPKPNPAYRTRAGRATLEGKPLDVALDRLRGYSVDVVYIASGEKRKLLKRPAGQVVLLVNDKNVVEKAR